MGQISKSFGSNEFGDNSNVTIDLKASIKAFVETVLEPEVLV